MSFYPIYKYLIYIPWLVLWTAFNFLGVVFVAPFSQRKASRWFGRSWGRGLIWLVPSRLRIDGVTHLDPSESYIVVVNHQSLMDIPILYGWLKLDLKWVMKKELRKVPFIGGGCALMGHIFLDRTNRHAALQQLQCVKQDLLPGTSILFFPEGTRSRTGKMLPFKKGAFRMAKDLDLPILPVSIRDADTILPPDGMGLRPGSATMRMHPAITRETVRSASLEELRNRAYQAIDQGRHQITDR